MAKSSTITFNIVGKDDLSHVLANAQKNLKGLTSATLTRQNKALADAQAALKNIHDYRNLQKAFTQAQKSYLSLGQDMGKIFAQRRSEQSQLEAMQRAYARLQQAYKDNRKSLDPAQALNMKSQLKSAQAELKAQAQLVRDLDKSYDAAASSIAKLKTQLASQQTQLAQARQTLPAGVLAAHEMQLRSQINQTTAALNAEIAALERRNQIHSNFSQRQQELANAYSNFQSSLDTAATIMNPFEQAADNAMTFEKSMDRVQALTQMRNIRAGNLAAVNEQMAALNEQAERLGMTTEFYSTEIAATQGYLGMAGWDYQKIMAGVKPIIDLTSIVADRDIARMADVFSDVMTAMSLKPGQMLKVGDKWVEATEHFGDAMAFALTQSNMNREDFFQAMKYSAPIAATAELTVGEQIATNMVVASSGLKGSQAGTGFRSGLLTLAGANKRAQAALEEVGMTSSDAQRQMAEAQDTFNQLGVTSSRFSERVMQLGEAFSKMSADERLTYAYKIFGKNAATFWTKFLSSDSLKQFAQFADEIDSGFVTGWNSDSAAIMRDNTKTSIDYMTSALDALQKAAGDALLPAIRSLAEAVTPLITSLAEFIKRNPAVVQGLAAVATAASAAIVSIAGFSLAMAGVRFAQAGFATAGLLFGKVAAGAAALKTALSGLGAGLIARLSTLGAALSGFTLTGAIAGIKSLGSAILGVARAFMMFPLKHPALTAIAAAAYFAYNNWDKVVAAFSKLGSALSSSLGPAFANLGTSFSNFMTSLSPLAGVFENLGGVIISVFIGVLGTVGSLISGLAVLVTGLFKSVAELGTGIVEAFTKIKDGDFAGAFESLTQAASQSADSFASAWLDAANAVKTGIKGTDEAIQALWTQPAPDVSSRVAFGAEALPTSWGQVDTTAITQPIADASAQTSQSLQQITMPADATSQSLSQMPPVVDSATNSTSQLANALPAPIEGLNAVGVAASSAASALEAAAGRINSIDIRIPQISYFPMTMPAPVASNASGGIYSKGAFLTTFAESSPEAAIPLDNSARSKNLWLESGEALGMFNDAPPISLSLTFNIAGDANPQSIKSEVVPLIQRTFAEQLANYNHERRRRSFV